MTDTLDVTMDPSPLETSEPSDTEGMLVDALVEMRAEEDSATSVSPDEQGDLDTVADENTDVKAEAKEPDAEAKAEEHESDTISKKAFLKRVNGLQAAKRKLESSSLDKDRQLSEYREAFQILKGRLEGAEKRLYEYEEVDPRQQKIDQYEREKYAAGIREKLEAEHQQRIKALEQESLVESRAEQIVEEANRLSDKYPTLTAEELVYKFRSSNKDMETLAKSLHEKRYGFYKEKMAKDYKKPRSPKAIRAQGAMAPIAGISEDDMMEYLQSNRS